MFGYKDLNIRKIFEGSWNLKFFALTATIGILGIFLISFLVYPQLSQKTDDASAANGWNAMNTGANHNVATLSYGNNNLYAGGYFSAAGGVAANNVARWDGNDWSALGTGTNGYVYSSTVLGSDLYVGGSFTTAGTASAKNIAKWDGTSWSAVGTSIEPAVYSIINDGTNVYIGTSETASYARLYVWNGTILDEIARMGGSTNDRIFALLHDGTNLYAAGSFLSVSGVSASNIARWNGSTWSPLGTGVNNRVRSLAYDGVNLYACGEFTTAGGVTAIGVAKWDGTSWSSLGDGTNASALSLAHDGEYLYMGGYFSIVSGVNANKIAKWDGMEWSEVGGSVDTGNLVDALNISDSILYMGGSFSTVGGINANNIAYYVETVIPPDNPANLAQKQTNGTTIPSGGTISETSVLYDGVLSDPDGDTVQLCVEKKPVGTTFSNTEDSCGDLVTSGTTGSNIISDQADNSYHWQARAKDSTGLYSNWVAFGSGTDYIIDAPDPPDEPVTLTQKLHDGTIILNGGTVSQNTIVYTGNLSDPDGDTVQLCVEKKPIGITFTNTEDSCGSLVASGSTGSNTISSQADGSYHWQARAKDSTGLYSNWVEFASGTNYIINTGGGGDDDIIPGDDDDDDDNDDDTTPTNQLEVIPPEVTVVPGETSETITIRNLKKLSDENGGTVCLWVPGSQWKNIFVLEKPDGSDSVTGHDALVIDGDDVTLKLRGISVGTGQMYISTARGCSACEKNGECETSIGNPVVLYINVVRGGGGGDDTGDDDDDDTIGIVDDDPIVGGKITDGSILDKSLLQTLYDILSAPFKALGASDSTLSAFFAGAGILFSALGSLAAPISNMLIVPTFISDTVASTWNSILMFFGVKKRKRERQGRVIEAGTDLAVPWATVKILKMEKIGGIYNKRVIATTKTDKQGYFRFIVPPGEYTIIAEKKPYEMYVGKSKKYYSQNTILKISDYKHGEINVRVAMTIPQGYLKKRLPAFKILGKFEVFFKVTSYVIMILGTIIAIYAVVYNYSTYNLAIIIVYIGLWAFWIISAIALKRSSPWGETIDRSSKEPIDLALVRILDDKGDRVLRTSVTDAMGKYTALLQRSKYQVRASKYGYKLHNPIKVNIKETKGVLSETLLMDKSKEMD